MSDRTRAESSFFQTQIYADLRRFEIVRDFVRESTCRSACSRIKMEVGLITVVAIYPNGNMCLSMHIINYFEKRPDEVLTKF